MLPQLTLNRAFMVDFSEAEPPCFALGMVAVDGKETGFLAMRPKEAIPGHVMGKGFQFGHALFGTSQTVLAQFVFRFYGHALYQALVNPALPMVQNILTTMIAGGDYFFFALNPGDRVTAFRSEIDADNLAGMRDNLPAMQAATTTHHEYEQGVRAFARNPAPEGTLMNWVCRDNPEYLDLVNNVATLNPAGA